MIAIFREMLSALHLPTNNVNFSGSSQDNVRDYFRAEYKSDPQGAYDYWRSTNNQWYFL